MGMVVFGGGCGACGGACGGGIVWLFVPTTGFKGKMGGRECCATTGLICIASAAGGYCTAGCSTFKRVSIESEVFGFWKLISMA